MGLRVSVPCMHCQYEMSGLLYFSLIFERIHCQGPPSLISFSAKLLANNSFLILNLAVLKFLKPFPDFLNIWLND